MLLRPLRLLVIVVVVTAVGGTVPLMYTLGAKGAAVSRGDMLAFASDSSQSPSVCTTEAPYPPWLSVSKCVSNVEDTTLAIQRLFSASIPITDGIRVILPPWFNASTTGATTVSPESVAIMWLSIFVGATAVSFASYIAYHNCGARTTTAYAQVQSSPVGH